MRNEAMLAQVVVSDRADCIGRVGRAYRPHEVERQPRVALDSSSESTKEARGATVIAEGAGVNEVHSDARFQFPPRDRSREVLWVESIRDHMESRSQARISIRIEVPRCVAYNNDCIRSLEHQTLELTLRHSSKGDPGREQRIPSPVLAKV